MNREILFRGQHRRKGEKVKLDGTPVESKWVYGGICQFNEDRSIIYQTEPEFQKYPVYTDTVGQYTGLKDKNGRKIFEGDIVRRFNRNGQEIMSYVVEWYSDCCMFVLDCIDFDMEFDTDFTVFYGDEFEIVGNIHDNPELVRKDEENESSYKSD